jgi:hypothetical protein
MAASDVRRTRGLMAPGIITCLFFYFFIFICRFLPLELPPVCMCVSVCGERGRDGGRQSARACAHVCDPERERKREKEREKEKEREREASERKRARARERKTEPWLQPTYHKKTIKKRKTN